MLSISLISSLLAFFLLFVPAGMATMEKENPGSFSPEIVQSLQPVIDSIPSTDDLPIGSEEWSCPCSYERISSPFGWRIHPIFGKVKFHSGVDLSAPEMTPIYAVRAGTVRFANWESTGGNQVYIDHGDGYESRFLHMHHSVVHQGESVRQGQVIGYVGSTGNSTGPHLHLTLRYLGKLVDPADHIHLPTDGRTAQPPEETTDPPQQETTAKEVP